jgi:imidazolonepropionase-like amidohydrolase
MHRRRAWLPVASVGPFDDTAGAAEIIDLDGRFVLPGL